MKFDTLLFDLDGTLTNPALGITNAVMASLKDFGITVRDRRELYPFIGPPLVDSFREVYGFSDAEVARAIDVFHDYFGRIGKFENELLPGAVELLGSVKASGYRVALATSKPEIFARQILDHFALTQYFDGIFGASYDEKKTAKADIVRTALEWCGPNARALMIGDRRHDVEGARANGIPCAGVLCGFGSEEELRTAGAAFVFADLPALESFLRP